MLTITVPGSDGIEMWDEVNEMFISTPVVKDQTLQLEHSLVSLSKWESKWHKSFFSKQEKTMEEELDYVKCMTLTRNVDPEVYNRLTNKNFEEIKNYINDPMTATYFSEDKKSKANRDVITSELIYYWMIASNIPVEFEKWHINRLITLIRVCEIKNSPPKKMSRRDIMSRNAALNAARRQQFNTTG